MSELRSLCAELGWVNVQTYIQSGNLTFRADAAAEYLENQLEQAIERRFGFSVAVVVRPGADWPGYVQSNPYPDASRTEPNLVMLALSKTVPNPDAADRLQDRAAGGERVVRAGDAPWIHYAGGGGNSKLSPGLLDRAVGSPVTTRNWRTVLKLEEMIHHPET